jgi:hypothetical protein
MRVLANFCLGKVCQIHLLCGFWKGYDVQYVAEVMDWVQAKNGTIMVELVGASPDPSALTSFSIQLSVSPPKHDSFAGYYCSNWFKEETYSFVTQGLEQGLFCSDFCLWESFCPLQKQTSSCISCLDDAHYITAGVFLCKNCSSSDCCCAH